MALELDPPNFIQDAAREEGWTDTDRRDCERMLHEAFEKSFDVKTLQCDGNGLYAYDAAYPNFEPVVLRKDAEKPVLEAVRELSKTLLARKLEYEKTLEAWFHEKGFDLYWDSRSKEGADETVWIAIAIPHGSRVGAAAREAGATKIEAAYRLRAQLEDAAAAVVKDATVAAPPAEATAEAPTPDVKTVSAKASLPMEVTVTVSGEVSLPYEILKAADLTIELPTDLRKRLEERAVEFGWIFGFTKEPDGSFTWLVFDENGDALQSGVADDWGDARLDAIAELYPPSDEGQRGSA